MTKLRNGVILYTCPPTQLTPTLFVSATEYSKLSSADIIRRATQMFEENKYAMQTEYQERQKLPEIVKATSRRRRETRIY